MAQSDIILPVQSAEDLPVIRTITFGDLADALRKGTDDFLAMRTHVVFLCAIYPLIGLLLFYAAAAYDMLPLLYPLAAGFALLGPFAAIGLYELSRRRERGLDIWWRHAFDVFHSPSLGSIFGLGLLLLVIFLVWMVFAHTIYVTSFGVDALTSPSDFLERVLTTPQGHYLIVVGNAVGFVFALVTAILSVVSLPLLLDRDVGFYAAVITSVRAVLHNPIVMGTWFLIVALALLLGALPALVGLIVVLPMLGHATWHLYRKVVEPPDESQRPEYHPHPRYKRYAAEFPASLFAASDDRDEPPR